ncbi:cell wall structural complex MreBCD, actin-like component MreB [Candidatus Kuenenia stuttgartiensis]|uniref:Cell shape-determining protein MreB n=1 Tax=Kuenenia stuttgartiensis TaxID=174633 RepID=Q1PZZ1_KUEST|nr:MULTISPECIES: rod shape-determining protein [Kuenenia]MBE7546594.1 rod shape-determining protein [Planctomycetia bacterium]MBZ0191299.1 rod shape-determining protein [Candidatus Kuenenia stuttgartiensis]MCF6151263.1 rod shape-determining protein [Candidatus Kuenenia stuttgartiensis]MCL4725996.1 rod shape-determining protein [Candidatus Kuenenia stuttgartiensis]MCZ7621766.1 rod shape-determining protein [Candidatus Kuenenia sp.]
MHPLDFILGFVSTDMGIDLGTANTLVCIPGHGIVLSEPSVVAVKPGTNKVLLNGRAVGIVAKSMLEKAPSSISVIRPLKNGVIADFDITEAMLKYFITKVHKRKWGVRPRILIAIPSGITAVEKRAVVNSAERAGAREVYLVSEPKAAAIGVGLPVGEPEASMVVDIGGGTTEVAVLCLGDIFTHESLRIAGDELDEAIVQYVRKTYNLDIGHRTAEQIKILIGSAYPLEEELKMEVRGRDAIAGLPRATNIGSEEIREALKEPIDKIVHAVKATLEKTAPELASDLLTNGLVLVGGGALIKRLDTLLAEETGLPVRVADDPLTAVAKGTGYLLENLDLFKAVLYDEDLQT